MLGFAYFPLISSWICPPAVFESPAFSTLVRLLMDLRFYPPLLVPLLHRGCPLWSRVERLLLSDTCVVLGLHASGAELPLFEELHVLHGSAQLVFYSMLRLSGYSAYWVSHVGVGRCWI
jgi:hypothetical protein